MRDHSGLWAVLLLLLPEALSGQAALVGTIRDDSSKAPVAGVEVVIQALNKTSTTDSAGRFSLSGLAHGAHSVLVRSIGYRPIALRAYLVTNDTLEVDLKITKAPVVLPAIEVTATSIPPGLETFEERRLGGFGHFIDWTSLRKQDTRRTSDLFREIPGVRIRYDRSGQAYLVGSRGGTCAMQVYLDGLPIYKPGTRASGPPPSIDLWSVDNLDAIEVYRGLAETPAQLTGAGANCGTVVLWTRRH